MTWVFSYMYFDAIDAVLLFAVERGTLTGKIWKYQIILSNWLVPSV